MLAGDLLAEVVFTRHHNQPLAHLLDLLDDVHRVQPSAARPVGLGTKLSLCVQDEAPDVDRQVDARVTRLADLGAQDLGVSGMGGGGGQAQGKRMLFTCMSCWYRDNLCS
jgi:hypothetical protein